MLLEIVVDNHDRVTVDLYRNPFVDRWCKLFKKTYIHCPLNQQDSFAHAMPELQAREKLSQAISKINLFLKTKFVPEPTDSSWEDRDWYNQLHMSFEKISGSFDNPTKLFQLAPFEIKSAIRDLNFYVHRLESRPYQTKRTWIISFDKQSYTREPFDIEDYKFFQHEVNFGTVFAHYTELGKSHYDLYNDSLPLDYPGLKNSHHYSAEFCIWMEDSINNIYDSDFYRWANNHSIDVHEKTIGLGIVPLGQVRDLDTLRQIAYNGTNITSIRIHHGQTI